jgi:hypothetical protein
MTCVSMQCPCGTTTYHSLEYQGRVVREAVWCWGCGRGRYIEYFAPLASPVTTKTAYTSAVTFAAAGEGEQI